MPANKNGRRLLHRVGIEVMDGPPNAIALQDRRRPARQNSIFVVALHGAEPRIERVFDGR